MSELNGLQLQDADLLAVFKQFKKHMMKELHVASIGKVKSITTAKKSASVQLYPMLANETEKNIECTYVNELESILAVGDIVLIVFCDRNFLAALTKLRSNQKPSSLKENIDLHADRFGIIIGTL